ncbi:MAG TPA: GNAT family N-acetyltransferase [Rhodocyclaceae bacterium]|nr:GNAT family N-acetyltransferase [Rhodocyclaceae bacterium]
MPDTLFSLRPEAPLDDDFLVKLFRSTRDDLLHIGLPEPMLDNLIAMQFRAQQNGHRQQYPEGNFCIVEAAGEPVGSLAVCRGTAGIRLINIALRPEARGNGLGSRLIRALQAEATASAKPLTLSVSTQNIGAQRLYAKLGFTAVSNNGAYQEMAWPAPENA